MHDSAAPLPVTPDAACRHDFAIAAVAAALAAGSDFLMLFAAFASRAAPPPLFWEVTLWIGGVLGLATVPFYALGYRGVACVARRSAPRLARVIALCGVGIGIVGAAVHGLTLFMIRASLTLAAITAAPATTIDALTGSFLVAWALASLLVLIVAVAIFLAAFAPRQAVPAWLAWLNPGVMTLALGIMAVPWALGRDLLLPAAPNLGHAIFFTAALLYARRSAQPS